MCAANKTSLNAVGRWITKLIMSWLAPSIMRFTRSKPDFDTADILRFLEQNRELNALNAHLTRNEGLQKSLLQDEQYRRADEQQHDGDCLP